MTYYIANLYTEKIERIVHSREAVIEFLMEKHFGLWSLVSENLSMKDKEDIFRVINMTGNDTAYVCDPFSVFPKGYMLRKYQVIDENNRIVDPRTWNVAFDRVLQDPLQYREIPRRKRTSYGVSTPGRHHHFHRHGLPAMMYQSLKNSMDDVSDDLIDLDIEILEDRTAMRKKSFVRGDLWDACEKKTFRTPSKSWKDQSSSRKQWGKHKVSCKRTKEISIEEDSDMDLISD